MDINNPVAGNCQAKYRLLNRIKPTTMDIATIDHIPSSSRLAASIDTIAICDNLNEIKELMLPAKVDLMLLILCERGSLTLYYDSSCQKMTPNIT